METQSQLSREDFVKFFFEECPTMTPLQEHKTNFEEENEAAEKLVAEEKEKILDYEKITAISGVDPARILGSEEDRKRERRPIGNPYSTSSSYQEKTQETQSSRPYGNHQRPYGYSYGQSSPYNQQTQKNSSETKYTRTGEEMRKESDKAVFSKVRKGCIKKFRSTHPKTNHGGPVDLLDMHLFAQKNRSINSIGYFDSSNKIPKNGKKSYGSMAVFKVCGATLSDFLVERKYRRKP